MIKNALAAAILLFSCMAGAAIRDVGNGGLGVELDGRLYTLDLAEYGLHLDPYFDSGTPIDPNIMVRIKRSIPIPTVLTLRLLAMKLTEIQAKDPILAEALLRTMEIFKWQMVPRNISAAGRSLETDERSVPARFRDLHLVAERLVRRIQISWLYWRRLSPANQAALIIHEVVYALIYPYPVDDGGRPSYALGRLRAAARTRFVVAEMFRPGGYRKARLDLANIFPPRPYPAADLQVWSELTPGGAMVYFWGHVPQPDSKEPCDHLLEEMFGCSFNRRYSQPPGPSGNYGLSFQSFGELEGERGFYVQFLSFLTLP